MVSCSAIDLLVITRRPGLLRRTRPTDLSRHWDIRGAAIFIVDATVLQKILNMEGRRLKHDGGAPVIQQLRYRDATRNTRERPPQLRRSSSQISPLDRLRLRKM